MARFCTMCGCQMNDEDVFCINCGAAVRKQTQTPPRSETPSQTPNEQQPIYQQPVYPQVVYVQARPPVPGRGLGITSLVLGILNILPTLIVTIAMVLALILLGYQSQAAQEKWAQPYISSSNQNRYEYYSGSDYSSSAEIYLVEQAYGKDVSDTLSQARFWSVYCMITFIPMSIMTLLFAIKARKQGYVNGVSKAGYMFGVIEVTLCVCCAVLFILALLLGTG